MKKVNHFLPLLLVFSLFSSLLIPTALAEGDSASDIISSMKVDAAAALLVDMDTDTVLYDQNGGDSVYPASLTKVMTALVVLRHIEAGDLSMDDVVTTRSDAWDGLESDASSQNIRPGEKMSVENLMQCMLVASASEAANILAQEVDGTVTEFVAEMNQVAKELGCNNTNFVNPSGMPDDKQVSTCYDLYLMGKAAMEYDDFRDIVKMDECYIDATNMSERRHFYNTNALLTNYRYLGYTYSKCIGIKTGSTEAAGYCLMSAAEESGKTLLAIVMGCDNPIAKDGTVQRKQFSESSRLLQWGFDNFSTIDIVDDTITYGTVQVNLSTASDHVSVEADSNINALLPNDVTPESFEKQITLMKEVDAPVEKGQVLGTMTLSLDGREYGTVNLVAINSVEASAMLVRKAQIQRLLSHWYVKALLSLVGILLLLLLLRFVVLRRRRPGYGSYSGRRHSSGSYRGSRRRRR